MPSQLTPEQRAIAALGLDSSSDPIQALDEVLKDLDRKGNWYALLADVRGKLFNARTIMDLR